MVNFVDNYCEFPKALRRPMWRIWHNFLIRFDNDKQVNFMNYGFENLNGEDALILHKKDEVNRYCIQLYHHLIKNANLEGKKVVEVGSGRGGGADFIARYFKPKTYTGIDISSGVINFCNTHYKVAGLSFLEGRAEKIPVMDHSCDAVVNVESARCYSNISLFFLEVHRILKDNGSFYFADMIETNHVDEIRKELVACGFSIEEELDITQNVARGLSLDTERRQKLINRKVPGFLRQSFLSFAGTKGTRRFDSFHNGKFRYMSYTLNKKTQMPEATLEIEEPMPLTIVS